MDHRLVVPAQARSGLPKLDIARVLVSRVLLDQYKARVLDKGVSFPGCDLCGRPLVLAIDGPPYGVLRIQSQPRLSKQSVDAPFDSCTWKPAMRMVALSCSELVTSNVKG